jgi:hypothetical protein
MEPTDPINILKTLSKTMNSSILSEDFALKLDKLDIWPSERDKFHYPKLRDLPKGIWFVQNLIYF